MNPFSYSDNQISKREFGFALPSLIIGVSILELPSTIADVTSFSDGWIPILIGGIIFTLFSLLSVYIAQHFQNESFFSYTSFLLTRPIAIFFILIYVIIGLALSGYGTRAIADISQQYLFDKTPIDVLALSFLLVIIYAISGERAGLFRLNMLFLPIILFVFLLVGFFNVKWFEVDNYFPLFKTDMKGYFKGILHTSGSFVGFGIGLFYVSLIRKPKKLTKIVITGMTVPIVFYIFIFLISIGVFGNLATADMQYPTIELAKRVYIPGAIFERIDAIVFTIWIMAIFNTIALILDIALLLLCSLFKKANKKIVAFILSPIVFYICMFPQQTDQVEQFSTFLMIFSTSFFCFMILLLFLMVKVRGVSRVDKK